MRLMPRFGVNPSTIDNKILQYGTNNIISHFGYWRRTGVRQFFFFFTEKKYYPLPPINLDADLTSNSVIVCVKGIILLLDYWCKWASVICGDYSRYITNHALNEETKQTLKSAENPHHLWLWLQTGRGVGAVLTAHRLHFILRHVGEPLRAEDQ